MNYRLIVLAFFSFLTIGNSYAQKKIIDEYHVDFILYFDSIPNEETCLKSNNLLSLHSINNPKELSDYRIRSFQLNIEKTGKLYRAYGSQISEEMKTAMKTLVVGDQIFLM